MQKYDCIVVGCGFAGAVAARELAEKQKRSHSLLYAPLHGFPAIKLLYISPSSPHPMVRKGNHSTGICGRRTECAHITPAES